MSLLDGVPRRSGWRWVVAGGVLVAAVAHVPVIGPHLREAPYMGVLFIALSVVCLALGGVVLVRDTTVVYGLAVLTCGLAIAGYAATRIVAFPQLSDDVGDWFDPLGVVFIAAETVVVVAGLAALRRRTPAGALSA